MRVRDWQDILEDVTESDAEPDGWRALGGPRQGGLGEDLFLGHPGVGLYQLKTYAKNPLEVRGVGTQVARSIDDEIGSVLPEEGDGRFAVRRPPDDEDEARKRARRVEETVKAHADAPTSPDDLFTDMMEALESPAHGPMEFEDRDRSEDLSELAELFADADSVLDDELEDAIEDDGVGRGFQ